MVSGSRLGSPQRCGHASVRHLLSRRGGEACSAGVPFPIGRRADRARVGTRLGARAVERIDTGRAAHRSHVAACTNAASAKKAWCFSNANRGARSGGPASSRRGRDQLGLARRLTVRAQRRAEVRIQTGQTGHPRPVDRRLGSGEGCLWRAAVQHRAAVFQMMAYRGVSTSQCSAGPRCSATARRACSADNPASRS